MKYNYYVYLPRIGTILVMFLTCSALFSKEIFFNIIYLVFVVLFSQILFIYEKRLLKNNEPQYEKISFRDSLLMYPILLNIELFLFSIVSLFSILILLCINKTIMALITIGVITIIISLYLNMRRHQSSFFLSDSTYDIQHPHASEYTSDLKYPAQSFYAKQP